MPESLKSFRGWFNWSRATWLVFAGIISVLFVIHRPLIVNDPVLAVDDTVGVMPLEHVHSLSDYINSWQRGVITDLIPVRDFSFWLDYAIKRSTGFSVFHFTNLAIWVAILFILHALLLQVASSEPVIPRCVALAVVSLIAFHPALNFSVAWVSARKHLLSCLFTLAATLVFLGSLNTGGISRKKASLCVSLYLFSILSQPITVLWPLWALFLVFMHRGSFPAKGAIAPAVICLILMLACIAANYWYYTGPYVIHTQEAKLLDASQATLGLRILALGRSFGNLIYPWKTALYYYPGSPLNIIGALLFPLFATLVAHFNDWRTTFTWLGFFFFPLSVVLARQTNVFVSDTYLLSPAMGISVLIFLSAGKALRFIHFRGKIIAACAALLLGGLFTAQSKVVIQSWASESALFSHSWQTEPSPENLIHHVNRVLFPEKRHQEACDLAFKLKDWAPDHKYTPLIFSRSIVFCPNLSSAQKIATLEQVHCDDPWYLYYLGVSYSMNGQHDQAFQLKSRALKIGGSFWGERAAVARDALEDCLKARRFDCDTAVER